MSTFYESLEKAERGWRVAKFLLDILTFLLIIVMMTFVIIEMLKIKAIVDDVKNAISSVGNVGKDIGKGIGGIF